MPACNLDAKQCVHSKCNAYFFLKKKCDGVDIVRIGVIRYVIRKIFFHNVRLDSKAITGPC